MDAMRAFGLTAAAGGSDWSHAVEAIAEALCAAPVQRAA